MSSVLRIPETAAVSRAAVRHSSILRVRDSREAVRRRGPARDSLGTVPHREHVRDSLEHVRHRAHVRQAKAVRRENVRYARRELCRAEHVRLPLPARQLRSVRQVRADRQETVRRVQRDLLRQTVRHAQTDRQETVLSVRTARDREGLREKAVRQETGQYAPTGRDVLTGPREAALSATEEGALTEGTEVKEAVGIRDQTDPDRAATAGIPAGTMWAHRW